MNQPTKQTEKTNNQEIGFDPQNKNEDKGREKSRNNNRSSRNTARNTARSGSRNALRGIQSEVTPALSFLLANFAPDRGPGLSIFDYNPQGYTPLSETYHENDDYVIRMEMPGVKRDDISIELNDKRLIVTGTKKESEINESGNRKLEEVRYGEFKRTYPVPSRVTSESIEAKLIDGVLIIRAKEALKHEDGEKINISLK